MKVYKSILVFLMTYLVALFAFLSFNLDLWHKINEPPTIQNIEANRYVASVNNIGFLSDLNLITLKVGNNLVERTFEFSANNETDATKISIDYQLTWLGSLTLGFIGFLPTLLVFFLADKKQGFMGFKNIRKFIFETNWQESLKQRYFEIDCVYRKAFWILFLLLNLVFAYHSVQFLWGNHDWLHLIPGLSPWWQSISGRFSGGFAYQILGGRLLPILGNMLSLFGIALAGVLLSIYWKIPKNIYSIVALGLFIGVCPYILSWFYFVLNTPTMLWTPTLIIGAFLLGDKTDIKNAWLYSFVSILLLLITLGGYAASINTIGVILLFKILLEYCFGKTLKEVIFDIRFTLFNIVAAFLIYIVIIKLLKINGIITSIYNTQTIEFGDVYNRLIEVFFASFKQFLVSYPFIDLYYLQILLGLVSFAFVILIVQSKKKVVVVLLISLLVLLATKATAFIAKGGPLYVTRIDWLGLLYVYAFAIAFILRFNRIATGNILFAFLIFILPMSILRDVEAQKVWKLGFDAEREAMYRLIERIESHPKYNPNNTYALITIGDPPTLRANYYSGDESRRGEDLLFYSYFSNWLSFNFFAPNIKMPYGLTISQKTLKENTYDKNAISHVLLTLQDFIRNSAEVFPKENSVFIDDKYIVVVWNEADLMHIRSMYR